MVDFLYKKPISTYFSLPHYIRSQLEHLIGGKNAIDLLLHWPRALCHRQYFEQLDAITDDGVGTILVRLSPPIKSPQSKKTTKINAYDRNSQPLTITYFNQGHRSIPSKFFYPNLWVIVSGKFVKNHIKKTIEVVHPDFLGDTSALSQWSGPQPIYPLTQGVSGNFLSKLISQVLQSIPAIKEWHDPNFIHSKKWPSFKDALHIVHHPKTSKDLTLECKARQRLIFDEFFAYHLSLKMSVRTQTSHNGLPQVIAYQLRQDLMKQLPFSLTCAQKKAIEEIDENMKSSSQMIRLLQGDVGCGKTIVAIMAMLNAVASGHQVAFLAPTDILARQHGRTITYYCAPLGIRVELLTAQERGKKRDLILSDLQKGHIHIIVGTHAILQKDVQFASLGFVVIDEQHRFGVHQRLELTAKGIAPDILLMSATPIPRSLMLTIQGEMDITTIDHKPKERKKIQTKVIPNEKIPQILEFLHLTLKKNQQIYWVCPLIEESEKSDLAAAIDRHNQLQSLFGKELVGIVHGGLKSSEKQETMRKFQEGLIKILVATTVIEVGVNVASASVMVIENANNFGLAQLHQLRGRVGRGNDDAYCFLLYACALNHLSKQRLMTMRESEDGFHIAQKDLWLRGGGNIVGTQQSGWGKFRLSHFQDNSSQDIHLLEDLFNNACEMAYTINNEQYDIFYPLLEIFKFEQALCYKKAG
jgi:ATP-dependent DNA helicase RecG